MEPVPESSPSQERLSHFRPWLCLSTPVGPYIGLRMYLVSPRAIIGLFGFMFPILTKNEFFLALLLKSKYDISR
jgi:hypothetical protein